MILFTKPHVRRYFARSSAISADFLDSHVPNLLEINSQIKQLVSDGHLKDARKVFDEMPQRDVVSWTNVISGYVKNSNFDKALHLFSTMWSGGGFQVA